MRTMEATLVKPWLRPARRALGESWEHTQGQRNSFQVKGTQLCLRLAPCCIRSCSGKDWTAASSTGLQPSPLPLGESWADGSALASLALGPAAHTNEHHTELAGKTWEAPHQPCSYVDTLFSQTTCILCYL